MGNAHDLSTVYSFILIIHYCTLRLLNVKKRAFKNL